VSKHLASSQAGASDSLPESLPSPLDSQKPNASTHVGPPYPDIGILTEDELSKHETKVNLLKSEWIPEQKSVIVKAISGIKVNIIFLQKNTL
jgi:hypothetical protein